MNALQTEAADLLDLLWQGVPSAYKSRYRMSIWQQFEDQVRSAAYTSSLARFVNSICSKLSASIGRTDEHRVQAETILNSGHDRDLLKAYREQTALLVLVVRVRAQGRQEEWEAKKASQKEKGEGENAHFDI